MAKPIPHPQVTPAAEQPEHLSHIAAPLSVAHPTMTHSGISISKFYLTHVPGLLFPVAAGLILYGWRALLVMTIMAGTTAATIAVWRRIGKRGQQLHYSHGLWMAMLLSLMLPAHLATLSSPSPSPSDLPLLWPILPACAILLVMLIWLLGGLGAGRIHPVIVAYLLAVVFLRPPLYPIDSLSPHWVLQPSRLFYGDTIDVNQNAKAFESGDSWQSGKATVPGQDAIYTEPASQRLISYTRGTDRPIRAWLTLEGLVRDRMPPLEDLLIGGHPGPIGVGCAIAVIIGGLILLYRGVIDFRVPILILAGAIAAFFILPIPIFITENSVHWRWLAIHAHGVKWPLAVTFVNYELFAGPILFMAFFLATAPAVRPMARRARVIYALFVGIAAAASQLYFSVSFGPYVALLLVSLLTPTLDKIFKPRALV